MVDLRDWMKTFFKNRDLFESRIVNFEDVGSDFVVHRSDGDVFVFVRPELSDVSDVVQKDAAKAGLALLNTKKNVAAVISNWDLLSSKKGLCLFFVNPKTNDKWLLYPYTHNQITDRSALKLGLESLFSGCPAFE